MSETKVSIQRQAKLSQSLVSGLKTLARQEKEKERKPKQRDGCKQALAMAVLEYSTLSTQGGWQGQQRPGPVDEKSSERETNKKLKGSNS